MVGRLLVVWAVASVQLSRPALVECQAPANVAPVSQVRQVPCGSDVWGDQGIPFWATLNTVVFGKRENLSKTWCQPLRPQGRKTFVEPKNHFGLFLDSSWRPRPTWRLRVRLHKAASMDESLLYSRSIVS